MNNAAKDASLSVYMQAGVESYTRLLDLSRRSQTTSALTSVQTSTENMDHAAFVVNGYKTVSFRK